MNLENRLIDSFGYDRAMTEGLSRILHGATPFFHKRFRDADGNWDVVDDSTRLPQGATEVHTYRIGEAVGEERRGPDYTVYQFVHTHRAEKTFHGVPGVVRSVRRPTVYKNVSAEKWF